MSTIKYIKTIYIRFNHDKNAVIKNGAYIIDTVEDDNMILYNGEKYRIEIVRFKNLLGSIEYIK